MNLLSILCGAAYFSTCWNSFLFRMYGVAYIPANNLQKKRNITVVDKGGNDNKTENTSVTSSRLTFNDITPSDSHHVAWNSTHF